MAWMPCCCGNTPCCPGVKIPPTLHGIFTSTCPALNGLTVPLTFSVILGQWSFFVDMTPCDTPSPPTEDQNGFSLFCSVPSPSNIWAFLTTGITAGSLSNNSCSLINSPITQVSAQCDPFQLVFQGTMVTQPLGWQPCAYAGSAWTLTITF